MLSPVRQYLPHILVGLSISLVMVMAYAAVGFTAGTVPKATWSTNTVTVTFPATVGTGSTARSFTCSPAAIGVTLIVRGSPSRVTLSVSPPSFSYCGSSPDTVLLTVHCLVPASQCRGTHSGLVQIRQPATYRDIPANLVVTIIVT